MWYDSWNVTYRDVIVVNGENEIVEVYNLTNYDLANPANYGHLRQTLVDTAELDQIPEFQAGDSNRDYQFNQLDIVLVASARKYGTGQAATWEEGDWNGDGVFNQLDVLAALQTGNYLQGRYAAENPTTTAVIPMYHVVDTTDTAIEDKGDETHRIDALFAELVAV